MAFTHILTNSYLTVVRYFLLWVHDKPGKVAVHQIHVPGLMRMMRSSLRGTFTCELGFKQSWTLQLGCCLTTTHFNQLHHRECDNLKLQKYF